ncbi:MAG TPA: hypothetical protein PKY25_02820 [Bacilli bacterium]|nr:hypothetical protein [Bacilli bacterium]
MAVDEPDFFDLGVIYARKTPSEIKIKIGEILVKYGKEKADLFLIGLSTQIPEHMEIYSGCKTCIYISKVHGTCGFGKEGLRNNSYFDGSGVSHECDKKGNYNEPNKGAKVKVKV